MLTKECILCKKLFKTFSKKQKFCSSKCYWEKLKVIQKGETNNFFGKKHSQSTKNNWSIKRKGIKHSQKTIDKLKIKNNGVNNPAWKGGRVITPNGYVLIHKPSHPFARKNYVFEHRFIAEIQLGRFLKPNEQIHHINKIKNDNRIENLMVFASRRSHVKFEFRKEVDPNEIIFDGSNYTFSP